MPAKPLEGTEVSGNGASVDFSLGWDGALICRITNVPIYQLLDLFFDQGIPHFEIPAATQNIAS